MDCVTTITNNATASAPNMEEVNSLKNSESAESFQHFIYDLFEKNGILNDLRAYLRGHIVEVIKNAQTGSPLSCQKYFTQRLELANQALNMLVAEYLLRYEFSYSLSVFVSEIPLPNMVFGLAKNLMDQSDDGDQSNLWFSESDVWLVLNYLGIKCDAEHASGLVEKYKKKDTPLLLCILKCLPFYCRQDIPRELRNSSVDSLTSEKSSESLPETYGKNHQSQRQDKCKHYAHCKLCQSRLRSVKEKYVKKKKNLSKNANVPADTQNTENLMKNISLTEKVLVDEMFHQLKNVYETEVELVKEEEERKYKRLLAAYAEQLQRRQTEIEETYKQRETDLEDAVRQKKKFLWGLAQSLRDQHHTMAAAMSCVKGESERLSAKEDNLKTQLQEAEKVIKNRSEEMREQISKEILILEAHLEAMKRERDSIDREKSELENFKIMCESKMKLRNEDNTLDTLKKEIVTLKKFVETKKCVAEKYTMTDLDGGSRMNNQDVGVKSDSEERVGRTPNRLVNDLKKQKNVNFSQSQLDMHQGSHRDRVRSQSSEFFDERESRRDAILLLQDENDRLKHFARQQGQHIDELNIQTARLQAELEAARLRSEMPTNYENFEPRLNTSVSARYDNFPHRRLGAGEDSNARVVRDRRADTRRYLVQQWRAMRTRHATETLPETHILTTVSAPTASHPVDTESMREIVIENDFRFQRADQDESIEREMPPVVPVDTKPRSKSPKTMLKEVKQKLRNKDVPKNHPQFKREKSPNSVLREAKLRLRKLEIEAEAVEKSYLDFRKRQTVREENRNHNYVTTVHDGTEDSKRSPSLSLRERINNTSELHKCKRNLDTFLSNCKAKLNVADSDFIIKSAKEKVNDKENFDKKDRTYLDAPLIEFRKLYSQNSAPRRIREEHKLEQPKAKLTLGETRSKNDEIESYRNEINNSRKDDEKELQILKENINKINLQKEPDDENNEEIKSEESRMNLLRIEVECVTKTDNLKLEESSQDLMLVVQSSAETKNLSVADLKDMSPQITVIVSPKFLTKEVDDNILRTPVEVDVNSQDQSPRILRTAEGVDVKSQDQSSNILRTSEEVDVKSQDHLSNILHTPQEVDVESQHQSPRILHISEKVDVKSQVQSSDILLTSEGVDVKSQVQSSDILRTAKEVDVKSQDQSPNILHTPEEVDVESQHQSPRILHISEEVDVKSQDQSPRILHTSEEVDVKSQEQSSNILRTSEEVDVKTQDQSSNILRTSEEIDVKSQEQSSNILRTSEGVLKKSNMPVQLENQEKLTQDLLDTIEHIEVPEPVQGGPQEFESLSERDKSDEYIEDFSADVDNYNSRSDDEENSPISHVKSSEDENFWDN